MTPVTVQQVPARPAGVRGGARAAGRPLPPVLGETHVPVRGVLPQQARLRVHRLRA